jgi:pyrimidine-nucleoside phosphorylase
MTASQIIALKRDGQQLSEAQIAWFIQNYTNGEIPDYQMSALSMAICINGMEKSEITALTIAMLESGIQLTWPQKSRPLVDKHSTGGIGDKVSLVLAPLLACCGLSVPMISGRGLGITGGTLDKLESIEGFRTNLTLNEIEQLTTEVGCVITGATEEIAPADRKWYALRDVTATVPSVALITGSIMSKKLAEGLDALVLDVKCGGGSFMKTLPVARALAESLVAVGTSMDVTTSALITDMQQPLGKMIGNAVEVNEALSALEGEGPADLRELTLALGTEALISAHVELERPVAKNRLAGLLDSGHAREKFAEMVSAQGGQLSRPREVAAATSISAPRAGYVARVDAEQLGQIVVQLGGGRTVMSDRVDYAVGLEMQVRIGDIVEQNQELIRVFSRNEVSDQLITTLTETLQIEEGPFYSNPLILDHVHKTSQELSDE